MEVKDRVLAVIYFMLVSVIIGLMFWVHQLSKPVEPIIIERVETEIIETQVVVIEKEIVETVVLLEGDYTEQDMFNAYLEYMNLLIYMHEGNFDNWEFVWNSETNELDMFRWVNGNLIFEDTITYEGFVEVIRVD